MKTFEEQQKEKRLQPRKTCRTKILLENEFREGLVYLFSKNISISGIFLEEAPSIKVGAHLFLSFMLPFQSQQIRVVGQVVRFLEPKDAKIGGVGIRFIDLDEESLQAIQTFVKN